jgi:hypothetical protein
MKEGIKAGKIELKLVASIKMIPMNTYYLHDGTVLSGPFTLDELKAKKLKLLPFGVKAWKMEYCRISRGLKKTLFSTPPQIKSFVAPSTPLKNESANEVKSLHV